MPLPSEYHDPCVPQPLRTAPTCRIVVAFGGSSWRYPSRSVGLRSVQRVPMAEPAEKPAVLGGDEAIDANDAPGAFAFEARRARMDWRAIHAVDVDRVMRENDIDTLESVLVSQSCMSDTLGITRGAQINRRQRPLFMDLQFLASKRRLHRPLTHPDTPSLLSSHTTSLPTNRKRSRSGTFPWRTAGT